MTTRASFDLSVTTQGPTYPPSEVMDGAGNFIVIGRINRPDMNGGVRSDWGAAIVSAESDVPPFGENYPYKIVRELPEPLSFSDQTIVLHTLPLPLPCHNYPMVFAPEQSTALERSLPSYPFHDVPIPDLRAIDGRKLRHPITLGDWVKAHGQVLVTVSQDRREATFQLDLEGLIPDSLYTVMSLRQHDLDPHGPTRPGPLGVPNVFVTDRQGRAEYSATLPNPFPSKDKNGANRIINLIVLWMSYQQNYGGAIGLFGLGGDIHAQLKLRQPSFFNLETRGDE